KTNGLLEEIFNILIKNVFYKSGSREVNKMSNKINCYMVKSLNKVNTTLYREGDIFINNNDVGMLVNGKIKKIGQKNVNLKDYPKIEEVQTMIDEALKGGV